MIVKPFSINSFLTNSAFIFSALCSWTQILPGAQYLELLPSYADILEVKYDIKAAQAGVCARDSERVQARALPNPIFNANLDSIGTRSGDDENELFVGITQLVEFGGKRPARIGVACANRTASEWNVELQKNELYANLLHSFITVAAAQERLALAHGQQKLAEQIALSVSAKAANGKTSGIDEKKALVSSKAVQLEYLRQQAQLKKAKRELMAFWDSCPPCFEGVIFVLYELSPLPDYCCLSALIPDTPRMALAQAEASIACNVIALERANAVPDVAFQVGVSTEKFVQQPALYVGIEVPLPIFDRNRGNIARAGYEQMQAVYRQLDIENELEADLSIVYEEWQSAYEQAQTIKESILPAADEAFHLAQTSYEEGKFDYLNLLDARRTLFDVQQKYLDAVEEYHHKRAEVIRITAGYPS